MRQRLADLQVTFWRLAYRVAGQRVRPAYVRAVRRSNDLYWDAYARSIGDTAYFLRRGRKP